MDQEGPLTGGWREANKDFEERLGGNEIRLSYDGEHDMLFVTIGQPQEAITEEIGKRLYLRVDPDSCKIVGFTITAFRKGFLRDNPDFKRHFDTVFGKRRRMQAWDVIPRTEVSEKASSALRELVPV